MNRFTYLIVIILLAACSGSRREELAAQASVVRTELPFYAKGFSIDVLADSTKRIVLYNLEAPGETLQVIHWKPRALNSVGCLSTTHIPFFKV